jgi:hypothetical protein
MVAQIGLGTAGVCVVSVSPLFYVTKRKPHLLKELVMVRSSTLVCLLGLAITASGCSKNPTAPSSPEATENRAPADAKAGPSPTPTPTPHTLTFQSAKYDRDGLPSPGHLEGTGAVSGWVTGSVGTGNVLASATGAYTVTVTDAAPLPPDVSGGNPCTAQEKSTLTAAGVLGSAVSGSLSLSVDQDGDPRSGSIPLLTWRLDGVRAGSDVWVLGGNSTVNFQPVIEGDATSLSVTLENGKIFFERHPNGAKKYDLLVGCRVDFTLTLTPQ